MSKSNEEESNETSEIPEINHNQTN